MTSKKQLKVQIKKQKKVYRTLQDNQSLIKLKWLESRLNGGK